AELAVRTADARYRSGYSLPVDLHGLEAALSVIDAHTGDVLALAGAPLDGKFDLRDPSKPLGLRLPGLSWLQNGSIGSVVKPFILVEHLECERLGLPHQPLMEMAPCHGKITLLGDHLTCDHSHYDVGRSPIPALAQSCNIFFYQAALGMQPAGVRRGLGRFGLIFSEEGDAFAACWQPRVPGL